MSRYIDAEITKEILSLHEDRRGYLIGDFEQIIDEEVPTANVRENVHASWVKVGQSFLNPNRFRCYACSKCGFSIDYIKFRFCPNCGADMGVKE